MNTYEKIIDCGEKREGATEGPWEGNDPNSCVYAQGEIIANCEDEYTGDYRQEQANHNYITACGNISKRDWETIRELVEAAKAITHHSTTTLIGCNISQRHMARLKAALKRIRE